MAHTRASIVPNQENVGIYVKYTMNAKSQIEPLGRTRLTHPSDFRETNALVVARKTDTWSIVLDCDRAQTRLVQLERRAR
jgi:hypothetical protein